MNNGLSNEALALLAPSIFAAAPAPSVSDKYAYFSTAAVLDAMRSIGLRPFQAAEGKKRHPDGRAFAMHEIDFRPTGYYSRAPELGELTPHITLRNSHDRTSPLVIEAGMERAVCTNGMRCWDSELGLNFTARHVGKRGMAELVAGIEKAVANLDRVVDVANDWQKISLSAQQQLDFAKVALDIKGSTLAIDPTVLLTARRHADHGPTLWRVFNRVQENIVKGGVAGRNASGKVRSLKRISTLAADVDFNRKLWAAAAKVAAETKPVTISVPVAV